MPGVLHHHTGGRVHLACPPDVAPGQSSTYRIFTALAVQHVKRPSAAELLIGKKYTGDKKDAE